MEITKSLKETPAESPEKNVIVNSILVMSTMASYTISNMSNNQPQGLELSVKAMNGSLKFLTCKKAGTSICEMSERYWKVHPEFEIPFAVNTIHWLLTQALQPKATVAYYICGLIFIVMSHCSHYFVYIACICKAGLESQRIN